MSAISKSNHEETLRDVKKLGSKDAVIIEDDKDLLDRLKTSLEEQGYNIKVFQSIEDLDRCAFEFEKYFAPLCIIDINLGNGKKFEGVDISKCIKEKVPYAYCVAYTSDLKVLNPGHKNVFDHILEKESVYRDSPKIIHLFEAYIQKIFNDYANKAKQEVAKNKENLAESQEYLKEITKLTNENDPNLKAYEKFKRDPQKITENLDYYVAFIDGELFNNKDKELSKLVEKIAQKREYIGKHKLIIKVSHDMEKLVKKTRAPSSLCRVQREKKQS